ncbi:hypothetical protein [Mucilaginibacter sp.]|uniref:hypothetical protein n=1 Tax=Mucilaginibacter sp. TaxID=1882438 RepID=UPI0025E909A5|nr:hypothetical protein [Mucilaginibacter sp.]
MKDQKGRRSFLKKISVGGAMAMMPAAVVNLADAKEADADSVNSDGSKKALKRAYNAPYTGDNLNRVAFPVGGMGAGMFCIEGTGAISHMSVRNKPDIFNEPGMFAAIHVKGITHGAKLLEGPVPNWKSLVSGMPVMVLQVLLPVCHAFTAPFLKLSFLSAIFNCRIKIYRYQ